ncbi:protein tyrosine phosphatase family protein [Ramlibacter algicola]|uniref:Protein tyrosine phosphatase family protein n=1 Tax=Ramlibacter algicola TaxID=2795217 RepID=A0A934UR57_9BURK|nr:protein tyrosine phosphatase family protein [Ramlibacter algicola]MBK0392333.1 protein tyrosine phosphatase family protein [Ramlibacter algicola]
MALLLLATAPRAQGIDAPNVVPVTELLVTSGQPTADALSRLGAAGFQAVIYLAPSTVHSAVQEEPALLAKQGIEFVQIPIPFATPSAGHFRTVTAALQRLKDKKVLVHCEVNMRASSMVFLHRVVTLKDEPASAFAFVTRVWSPRGPWRTLIEEQLRESGIRFELL